jgi:hypothetical protein
MLSTRIQQIVQESLRGYHNPIQESIKVRKLSFASHLTIQNTRQNTMNTNDLYTTGRKHEQQQKSRQLINSIIFINSTIISRLEKGYFLGFEISFIRVRITVTCGTLANLQIQFQPSNSACFAAKTVIFSIFRKPQPVPYFTSISTSLFTAQQVAVFRRTAA